LARIWLAAHWDKKLTKAHVYETNIEQSVDGIMQPKVKMALRTSGHLLLGVVRIYSRKARYLLADCNEAFVKIKMAFRPGMVDLPEDKREAAMNAITLPDVFHDFDTDMPDLDDMDIQHQFAMNQTRAEEITMREDYGNITLTTDDDGFGDSIDMEPPEMLRDAPQHLEHFGDELSLESEVSKARDQMPQDSLGGLELTGGPSTSAEKQMDAPIGDDGFGGAGLPDILSGGLFEEGSLFGDPMADHPPTPESSIGGDDFGGAPSPMHSDDESRPPTPLEQTAIDVPAPQLDETPVAPSPAPTSPTPSVQSTVTAVSTVETVVQPPQHDTTTLLHNEEESFALAPVEASVLKGEKRKRKRKLVVDDIKAITGEGMKVQLSDSSDIITTLDIAPPTKRLMHWKETGGVDELFNLPARTLGSKDLVVHYKKCLKMKVIRDEQPDTGEQLNLEYIGVEQEFEKERKTPAKERAPKRKRHDSESAYAKRQQDLVRQAEESAREEEMARRISLEPEAETSAHQVSDIEDRLTEQPPPEPGLSTPAFSGGFPTPVHTPADQSGLFGDAAPPADLTPVLQTSFTEQWVSQVRSEEMMSPPHFDDDDDHAPPEDLPEHDDEEEEIEGLEDSEQTGEDSEMQEDETIEQFEDRVLNKRAAMMHRLLSKKFQEDDTIDLAAMLKRNHRKQAAQKFYSVLVLQKVMAVDADQAAESFGPLSVVKGPKFDSAIKLL